MAVYRWTTGQAPRAITVWMEQMIAAELIEVKTTAAVPFEWAAAKVEDPLL